MIFRSVRIAAVVAMGLAPTAWAQQAAPQSASGADSLDEVVVTASKRKQRLLDVSGAISVQSGDDIDARRAQNMEALFAPIAKAVLYASTPGAITPDFRAIPYRKRSLNYWPRVALLEHSNRRSH